MNSDFSEDFQISILHKSLKVEKQDFSNAYVANTV